MRRLVWVAVGAVGGIYAYRRGSALLSDARERGVLLTAQQAALSARSTLSSARELAARASAGREPNPGRDRVPAGGGSAPASPARGRAAARALEEREHH